MSFEKNSKKISNVKYYKKAFSLIELSVVLIIISILITGALTASISSVNTTKKNSTEDLLEVVYKSLGNYLLINGHFPCPARLDLSRDDASYGNSSDCAASSGVKIISTNIIYGMLPVKDLGILRDAAQDAFGSKVTYIIDQRLTNSLTFASDMQNNGPSSYTPLSIVREKYGASVSHDIGADLILISHGPNQYGAFNAKSSVQNSSDGSADEDENDFSSSNNIFLAESESDDEFDDILFSKKLTEILQDFNAYHLVKCPSSTSSQLLYSGTSFTWPDAKYLEVVESGTGNCPSSHRNGPVKPTRKCSIYGQWGPIINPCI